MYVLYERIISRLLFLFWFIILLISLRIRLGMFRIIGYVFLRGCIQHTLTWQIQTHKNYRHEYTTPDRKHSSLFVIDVQRDFTLKGGAAEIPGTLTSVQYIKSLVQGYREVGHPLVHVIRLYNKDGSNVDLCRRKAIESNGYYWNWWCRIDGWTQALSYY